MKIISYSDLHLEFGALFEPSLKHDADVLVLAGDIITFKDYRPLQKIFESWKKPIIYVVGNHEYYGASPIDITNAEFKQWVSENHPHVNFLYDEAVVIDGVRFFGGTMWTDFNGNNPVSMEIARVNMNDYNQIQYTKGQLLRPHHTVEMHNNFVQKLMDWFKVTNQEKRVIVTHHAPLRNPNTAYGESDLQPAFVSSDMLKIIEEYEPNLWIYGHTHECHDEHVGNTRIISNQRGYPYRSGQFECKGYDPDGRCVEVI
jgi:predicted phosphodiesterase